jgi:Inner membrane protein YgaP-like, transmembrane domain
MKKNVGNMDRVLRAVGGVAMVSCSVMAPLPLAARMATFGAIGAYLLFTALAGTCFGYRLMGRSTCHAEPGR